MQVSRVRVLGISLLMAGLMLAGCGTRMTRAPVEDRGTAAAAPAPAVVIASPAPSPSDNGAHAGTYTVKPGDTLIKIGLDTGQSWKDIARWNQIENTNLIEVGQVLKVVPPAPAVVAQASPGVVTRPIAAPVVTPVAPGAAASSSAPVTPPPATETTAPAAAVAAAGAAAEDGTSFIWPASGSLIAGFDEARNKGLDIGGKSGDAVVAAADGRVVYAGAGLRGYGNLVILKHSNTFLTAYAHNRALLVKEDQTVRRGQKIAEMGNTDSDRVKLHFEIRRQGKPVDPARYLPAR